METLHTIHLHGKLARFGRQHKFAVNSPVEVVQFLTQQIDGFADVFKSGYYRLVRGNIDSGVEYGDETVGFSFGDTPIDFHFIPVIVGSKRGGFGKVIVGALMMIAAVAISTLTFGLGTTVATAGMSALSAGASVGAMMGASATSALFYVGVAVALSGVSMMLQPTPKSRGSMERADAKPSYFLSGPINMVEQGGALPVLYGRFMAGSCVINASLSLEDMR